jgi:hypothetical protein
MDHKVQAYKVRFPDQTYSRGGATPFCASRGKVWSSEQGLSSHITLVTETWAEGYHHNPPISVPHPYDGAEILDLVAGTETPVDVETSVKKRIAKIEGWHSAGRVNQIVALKAYLQGRTP